MFSRVAKMVFRLILLTILGGLFILVLPRLITAVYALRRTYSVDTAPTRPAAVVFGAGLWRDGSPTPVLRDRIATASQLYFSGKVQKLLMSGDNRSIYYNEPAAMQEYALSLGVPPQAIVLDYAGWSTYDTCYRARDIFRLEQVILVTQKFHLDRALYTCNLLGVSAVGVPADQREYRPRSLFYWNVRELPATLVALWEVHITRPLPVLGNPEPIFPAEQK